MGKLEVKVTPSSRKPGLVSFDGKLLRVRLSSKPEKGKANEELIELLSQVLEIRKGSIHILRGETSQMKLIEIENLSNEHIYEGLLEFFKRLAL